MCLFAPLPYSVTESTLDKAKEADLKWRGEKDKLLKSWKTDRLLFSGISEKRYEDGQSVLLDNLASEWTFTFGKTEAPPLINTLGAGKSAQNSARAVDRSCRVTTKDVINAAREVGIELDSESYASHVHVESNVMKQLDEVYLKHFRAKALPLTLLDCFRIFEDSDLSHQNLFTDYLDDVERVLKKLLQREDVRVSLKRGDPKSHGIAAAVDRLEPLFWPLERRICLPLATVSMLDDLKACILKNETVTVEVCVLPQKTPRVPPPANQIQGHPLDRRACNPHDNSQLTRCAPGLVRRYRTQTDPDLSP